MPVTCPNGHRSDSGDYCDECGVRLASAVAATGGGDPAGAVPVAVDPPTFTGLGPADPGPSTGSRGSGAPAAPAVGSPPPACPVCGEPRVGAERFCENDAYDFLTGRLPAADPADLAGPVGDPGAAPGAGPAAAGPAWALTVAADHGWWEQMATDLPFPQSCPVRTFTLVGPQVLLGRPRPSRGIAPEVDLTGPPLDEGISHAHALLTRVDTGWQLSDAGSTNGTWLPGAGAPLAPGQHVLLADGDTFLIGAWTAVTVRTT
ncbi:MAG: hypothetical protein V7637_2538 [Mycobacteriales bacterium]|jgi:hypothetical protein